MFFVVVNTYKAFDYSNCLKEIRVSGLNSKNLVDYIKNNNLLDKVVRVCSADICYGVNGASIEENVDVFIRKNIDYLEKKDSEFAIEVNLKGFRIEKIIVKECM